MTEREVRSAYQRQMNQIHLSEEKANETLSAMLAENRRLRTDESNKNKAGFSRKTRSIAGLAGALAAVVVLAVAIGINSRSPSYQFQPVEIEFRASSTAAQPNPNSADQDRDSRIRSFAETAFSKWKISSEWTDAELSEDGMTFQITLQTSEKDIPVTATITENEPRLHKVITNEQTIQGKAVRLGYDPSFKTYVAAYQQEQYYIVIKGQGSEKEFTEVLQTILGG